MRRSPNARRSRDRRLAHARRLGHGARRPMRGIEGRLLQGGHDQGLDIVVGDRTWHARTRLVMESLEALGDEPPSPLRHGRFARGEAARHLPIGLTRGALEHDATAKCERRGALWPPRPVRSKVSRSLSLSTSSALGLPRYHGASHRRR